MSQGKKLTVKREAEYKELYLKTLAKFNGIESVAINHIQEEVPQLGWIYYVKTKWRKEDEHFNRLCELEKANALEKIENRAYQKAMEGETQMLKFILERQKAGWKEEIKTDSKIEHTGLVSINIIRPLEDK